MASQEAEQQPQEEHQYIELHCCIDGRVLASDSINKENNIKSSDFINDETVTSIGYDSYVKDDEELFKKGISEFPHHCSFGNSPHHMITRIFDITCKLNTEKLHELENLADLNFGHDDTIRWKFVVLVEICLNCSPKTNVVFCSFLVKQHHPNDPHYSTDHLYMELENFEMANCVLFLGQPAQPKFCNFVKDECKMIAENDVIEALEICEKIEHLNLFDIPANDAAMVVDAVNDVDVEGVDDAEYEKFEKAYEFVVITIESLSQRPNLIYDQDFEEDESSKIIVVSPLPIQ